jgi:uncharacterized membrane-anchored protein
MPPRFRFTTIRLLLITAVMAVWVAVLAGGFQGITVPAAISKALGLAVVVLVPLCFVAMGVLLVRRLGERSLPAAFLGTVAYIALVAYLSWATWG